MRLSWYAWYTYLNRRAWTVNINGYIWIHIYRYIHEYVCVHIYNALRRRRQSGSRISLSLLVQWVPPWAIPKTQWQATRSSAARRRPWERARIQLLLQRNQRVLASHAAFVANKVPLLIACTPPTFTGNAAWQWGPTSASCRQQQRQKTKNCSRTTMTLGWYC